MRARWLVPVVAIVAVVAMVLALRAGADTPSSRSASSPAAGGEGVETPSALPARTVTVGAVDIEIEPIRIDETAAVFRVVMDTHSEDLSADLASTSLLEVGGTRWPDATWSGDPPGGHHREGELTFEASGPATGSVVMSIGGFSGPVKASWELSE